MQQSLGRLLGNMKGRFEDIIKSNVMLFKVSTRVLER
jgi:hypothetical protein